MLVVASCSDPREYLRDVSAFSANLGFLWPELALPDAIRAAAAAGFDAVECHEPYGTPAEQTRAALEESGLSMLGINTRRGGDGEFGLAALEGRSIEARLAIDEAIRYASVIGADSIHVLAGIAPPEPHLFLTYLANLRYACKQATAHDITILIEPLNQHDNPGYYLNNLADAAGVIDAVDRPNMKLLFDCYHVARTEGDVLGQLREMLPIIGHIQFASVPGRNEPNSGDQDSGDLDYGEIFAFLDEAGWTRPLGAEYRPARATEDGLAWLRNF